MARRIAFVGRESISLSTYLDTPATCGKVVLKPAVTEGRSVHFFQPLSYSPPSYQEAVAACSAAGLRRRSKNETRYAASESCCDRTKWWRNETKCVTVAFMPLLSPSLDVASFSMNSADTIV